MKAFLFACLVILSGCVHHAPPKPILLPATAAVRAPLVAAQTSVAKAQGIVAKATKTGLAAGSVEMADLRLSLNDTVTQLAEAHSQVDKLTAQLLEAQKQVDGQTAKLAWYVQKYDEAVRSLWWYRVRFWGPLVLAVAAAAILLLTKFTSWGAHTFGPYILGVEHIAAKAAILA